MVRKLKLFVLILCFIALVKGSTREDLVIQTSPSDSSVATVTILSYQKLERIHSGVLDYFPASLLDLFENQQADDILVSFTQGSLLAHMPLFSHLTESQATGSRA